MTFLVVFLIQSTQTRDNGAVHVKPEEQIRPIQGLAATAREQMRLGGADGDRPMWRRRRGGPRSRIVKAVRRGIEPRWIVCVPYSAGILFHPRGVRGQLTEITEMRIGMTLMGLAVMGIVGGAVLAEEKEDSKIDGIMKKAMKGKMSLFAKAVEGSSTDVQNEELDMYLKQLVGTKPPKGDQAEWDGRIAKLVAAADGVVAKKSGASAALKAAGNCKACHKVHQDE